MNNEQVEVNHRHEHLTEDQLLSLVDGQLGGRDSSPLSPANESARRHLDSCEDCLKVFHRFEEVSRRLESLTEPTRTRARDNCPSEEELRKFIFEDPLDVRTQESIRHATNCDRCAAKMRETVEDLALEPSAAEAQTLESLRSSEPEWQARLADRLAHEPRSGSSSSSPSISQSRKRFAPPWAFAAAATLLIAFLCSTLYLVLRKPSLNQLLLVAYSERRTLELRIPGAAYTPMSVQRGPAAPVLSPPSLLEAQIRIERDSARNENNAVWIAARGQAELLSHNTDAAIDDLKNALALSPGLFSARLDLASAFSERASSKNQPWDNADAVGILTKILQEQPQNQVAMFNLALILERQSLFHKAAEQWQNYLKIDSSSGWSDEARQHLERDERQIKKMSHQAPLLDGPEVASGMSDSSQSMADTLDDRTEEYLREATVDWLPRAFPGQPSSSAQDPYRSALYMLSRILQQRHQDAWLTDLLKQVSAGEASSAVSLLSHSVLANESGDYAEGARAAYLAAIRFSAAKNAPGYLRARTEEIYSLRLSHDAIHCNRLAAPVLAELSRTAYRWLIVQATLEQQECLNMQGDLGGALSLSEGTLANSTLAHYPQLYLRAVLFAADTEASLGNTKHAWRRTRDGLSFSWDTAGYPMRTYSLDTELDFLADRTNRARFDQMVLGEALTMLGADPDLVLRAMANHRLAQVELANDDRDASARHFQKAVDLFSAAPPTSVTENHEMEAEIGLARVEIQRKQFDSAAQRLGARPNIARNVSNRYLQIDFFQTLGEAYLGLNRAREADAALCSALDLTESALGTLHTDNDRLDWGHAAGNVYRTFVESRLHQHDFLGALEFWEWYRASTIPFLHQSRIPEANDHATLERGSETGCAMPQRRTVADQLPSLSQASVISYAVLPSGIAAWAYDNRGVRFHWISGDAPLISQLIERFTYLCAEPSSDRQILLELGRTLYAQLLSPFDRDFVLRDHIIIEPDGALWSVPFSALVRSDGQYLSDVTSVSEFPGIYYRKLLRPPRALRRDDTSVAVAEDAPLLFQDAYLPALPNAATEVETIAEQLPHTIILRNQAATLKALSRDVPHADVFHFAGHAVQTPDGAALIIAASSTQPGSAFILDASNLASLNLSQLHLAVLSACSTESGAEENGFLDSGSLVRAFMRGGVPEIVGTRWTIESAAAEQTMRSFYANLLRGASSADALRLAMNSTRAHETTSHPYYWAAFASFGWN